MPGQSADDVLRDLRAAVDAARDRVDESPGSVEAVPWRPPYQIDPERPIVRAVLAAARRFRNEPVRTISHPWWEDSGLLGAAGIDAVVLGPAGNGLHTEDEWVDTDSVVDLGEILYQSALSYCGLRHVED